MAREIQEFQAKVTAKDEASKVIDAAAKKGEEYDGSIFSAETQVKNEQALQAIHQIGAEAKQVEEQVSAERIEPKVDTTQAEQGVGHVREQAEGAKSALANMVGNTAQDLGQLGGVAGSSGVAIGQLSEYFVDAANKGGGLGAVLSSFAGPAGIATLALTALSVGLPLVIDALTGVSDQERIAKETTDDLTKAFHGLDSASSDLRFTAIAEDIRKLINDTPTLTGHINDLGVSASDIATEMTGGTSPAIQRVRDDYKSLTETLATVTTAQMDSAEARASGNASAVATDQAEKQVAASLGITVQALRDRIAVEKSTIDTIQGKVDGTKKATEADDAARAALETLTTTEAAKKQADDDAKKAAEEHTKKMQDQAKAIDDLDASMQHLNATWNEGAQAADSFNSVFGQEESTFFTIHQSAADVEDGFSKLGKTVHDAGQDFLETGGHLTSLSDDGRSVLDVLEPLGKSIATNLSAELQSAGGSYDSVRTKAAGYVQDLTTQLTQLGLNSDSIQGYIEMLNLTPEQVETTIKLSQQDEARKKIADLHVDISNIPEEARTILSVPRVLYYLRLMPVAERAGSDI